MTTTKAVFCDALGTLVELEPPWAHLAAALGIEPDESVIAAVRTEMTFYREHSHEASDEQRLAELRAACAELLERELGRAVSVETLMASIRFRPFPDAAPALARLGDRGLTRVCVSNWDIALGEVLERCGLAEALDGVVASAAVGARKPDPAIFAAALELAGCEPGEALHVGDTPVEDVDGAVAAGIPYLLLDRAGADGGAEVITSLAEIEQHLRT
jgi:putative hydrolase of the HAD superfamily